MKQRILLLLLPLLTVLGARAQTTLLQEGFFVAPSASTPSPRPPGVNTAVSTVDVANTTSYTIAATTGATAVTGNNNEYFVRAVNGTPPSDVTNAASPTAFGTSTVQNAGVPAGGTFPTTDAYFWIGEGVRGPANVLTRTPGIVQLLPVTVTGYTGLQVKIGLIDLRNTGLNWENDDTIKIQTRFDGTGAWVTVGQFLGDNANTANGGKLRQDRNLDGKTYDSYDIDGTQTGQPGGPAPIVTSPMSDFTFNVPSSGSTLQVRVVASENGLSEEFAFDNIRVTGTANSSAPPVLANLETSTINYAEGAAAVQITNTLTITDSDNTTLSGGTVRIVGFDASEDVLLFTNPNGITGSYNTSTGILTLSGTATLAAYQAALRSVQYHDTDATDATDGTRTIQFTVTDGSSATSSTVSRNILVTSSLDAAAALPYTDDLETDGEGTRYKSNHFTGNNGAAFIRTNIPNNSANGAFFANGASQTNFTGISNSYYWYGAGAGNPTNPAPVNVGTFVTKRVNAVGYTNVHFKVLLGATVDAWDSNDYTKFYYRANGGSWVIFASFRSTDQSVNSTIGDMARDADPTNLSSAPTGTVLGPAMAQFDFTLPAAVNGQQVDFMIEEQSQDGSGNGETFIFDKIEVTGTLLVAPTVTTGTAGSVTGTTASISNNTLTADGGANISDYGVVYVAGTGTPTASNSKVPVGTTSPSSFPTNFTANLAGLTAGTQYTARAYATNSVGTSYGANVTFTTPITVSSITTTTTSPTNASSISYTVTFASSVTGVSSSNFALSPTVTGASIASVSGAGTTYTVTVNTGTGNGPLQLNLANDTGISPGISNKPYAGPAITIDKTAPTVSSVAVPANGTYRTGQALSFTVTFSEAVTVTGTPQLGLTLDTGGSVQANYASGSGSTALVFTYTVVAGNADNNGIAVGTLGLNGGTIRDAAINNATLTLNNVAATTGVLVDGVAPVVSSINRQNPTATITNSTALTYRVTFSEAVVGVTASNFSLTNTGTANSSISTVTAVSTSVYDVTVSGVSGTGTVRLDLNGSGTGITDTPGNAISGGYTSGQTYTIDQVAPTVTALTTPAGASGTTTTTTPFDFTVTFSEAVMGFSSSGITVTNGSVSSGPTAGSGNSYTFTVTPTAAGTATTVRIVANATQDAAGNGSQASSTYSLTYVPATTVTSISKLAPTAAQSAGGTATAQVSFTVTFSAPVSGVSMSNFSLSPTISGASIASVSPTTGASTSYTVMVNTGTGNGTLQLNVANATGITPSVTNTPFSGTSAAYTVVKSFAAAPLLSLRGIGSATNNSDVTAFVDLVQVLQSGTGTAVANGLQNGSFESNNVSAGSFLYSTSTPIAVVAAPWAFGSQAGVSRNGSAFGSTAPTGGGDAVGLLQNAGSSIAQNLAVPTGSYQVNFQAVQRSNNGTRDQVVNVFLNDGTNDVFIGTIQPPSTTTYSSFTSATFAVTAPALTATVSTTASSPTGTSPIPFSVSFSQSVGTSFTASDVTVSGGTLNTPSFSGSGSGPYSFTVAPSGAGTVTVSVAAGVASDANNTANTASNAVSVQYQGLTITVAPATLPAGTVGTAYSQTITASGGTSPYTFSLAAGALPSGLALSSSGVLSGTPTVSGSFTFTVTATDASAAPGPYSGSRAYTMEVAVPTSVSWVGNVSTDWFTPGNWSPAAVPTTATDVVIPSTASRMPLISSNASTAASRNLTINAGATLAMTGNTLDVRADLLNNGTFQPDAGTVSFTGSATVQRIGGSAAINFVTLHLDKVSGIVQLAQNLAISQALTLSSGQLATASYAVQLGSNATLSETDVSYLTGTVRITRPLTAGSAEPFGGLGLTLTPAANSTAPGVTLVVRTTGTALTGTGTSQSILRYFDIQPTTNTGLNVQLELSYFDHERNGIPAASVRLFKSTTGTSGPWLAQSPLTISGNTVTKTGITDFSIWTLGNAANPLPVELTDFTAQAQGAAVQLNWYTASERNSARFEVERSLDGVAFTKIGTVTAAGTSATAHRYGLLDVALLTGATVRYYRLRQVDLDGTFNYSPVRVVALGGAGLALFPNPVLGHQAMLSGATPGQAVQVLDAVGRVVLTATTDAAGTAILALPAGLPAGVYVVRAGANARRLTVE